MRTLLATTFQAQATLKCISASDSRAISADIAAVIDVHECQWHGSLTVAFPRATIFSLLHRTHGMHFTDLNKTVSDAVGEIANVLFGMIKKDLTAHGCQFRMTLPRVMVLGHARQPEPDECPGRSLTFESDCGPLQVTVALCPNDVTPGKQT